MTKTTKANGSSYKTTEFTIGKTIWSVLVVSGKINYVSVKKITSNPFHSLGKRFDNFDEAVSNYKNPQMKLELLKIELGL